MAETDWTIHGAAAADIARGVTAGFTPPNGGGSYIFGFNSKVTAARAVVVLVTGTNFAPLRDDLTLPTGGSIQGALKRGVSTSPTGFSVGLAICLQGQSESDYGYILGLSDNDPHEVVLAKTTPLAGLDPTDATILAKSSATYTPDTWHHLRLDAIVNPNGDVVLKAFSSNLASYTVSAPTWAAIPGIADYIDDALGIRSAATGYATPLKGGYAGYFFQSAALAARGYVDHLVVQRQK